jgi:hypothetical protein
MRKMLKFTAFLLVLGLILGLAGCPDPNDGNNNNNNNNNNNQNQGDGIKWDNEPSGTLTVLNNTSKDMVVFQGQTPSANSILGGVKAQTTKTFDISDDVDDFDVGGYIILRGMTLDEYTKNKSNLATAKVEYSAMATYGQGKKFRTEISPSYTGDYYFKVTNGGRIGIELRKDSPDGEKIGYLPALATNYALYSSTSNSMTVFPVYVFYSNVSKTVTTIKPTSFADSVSVGPRPVTDSSVSTVRFPNDASINWQQIVDSITYPVAFITVTNNVGNQDAKFSAASKVYFAQNGYDSVNSGETLTFELKGTDEGQEININMQMYGGSMSVPVKQSGNTPTIKNGFNYTLTLNYNGSGDLTDPNSYTATITEGTKRNVTSEISSL